MAAGLWGFARQAAAEAAVTLAASSAQCKGAIIHSVYHSLQVCGGYEAPVRFTPGFGPLALAWGWCIMGILLGFLLGLHFQDVVVKLESLVKCIQRVQRGGPLAPPGLSPMPGWHWAVEAELRVAPEGPRRIILQRLVDEGDAALDLLAAAGGVTRRDALARVLGEQTVRSNVAAWRL